MTGATGAATWASDNEAVVTVAGGLLTAVSVGSANITVTADGKTATLKATIASAAPAPKPATGIKLSQGTWSGKVGDTKKLTVTAEPADADDASKVTAAIKYTTSDEAIVKVADDGTMTAVTAGTANITATSSKLTAVCKATITEA